MIDFFSTINSVYGTAVDFCTHESCPQMNAGPKFGFFNYAFSHSRFEYLWADHKNIKKPIKVSAPDYVNYLMTWIEETLEDETTFPVSEGKQKPPLLCLNDKTFHFLNIFDLLSKLFLNDFYVFLRIYTLATLPTW